MSKTLQASLRSVDAVFDGIESDVAGAVRPAAQAGAQVLYEEVRCNVFGIGRKTGNLADSIYQVYSKDRSIEGEKAIYHVSWNARKAPHGHLVEFGYMQRYRVFLGKSGKWITSKKHPLPSPRHVAANPFVRPAMAKFGLAADVATEKMMQMINGGDRGD